MQIRGRTVAHPRALVHKPELGNGPELHVVCSSWRDAADSTQFADGRGDRVALAEQRGLECTTN